MSGHIRISTPREDSFADNNDLSQRLNTLVEAFDYACDLDCSSWDFAVEITTLHSAGVSDSDLRWLLCKGYVSHGGETTLLGDPKRKFRPLEGLKFFEDSCFVLTRVGRRFAGQVSADNKRGHAEEPTIRQMVVQPVTIPEWNYERHELCVAGRIVKHFKLPAPNQEAVLMAFQEESWTSRIDDPIPPACDQDAKQRLRDTVKSLNRNQKNRLIRFSGDGSGLGVLWELVNSTKHPTNGERQRVNVSS